MRNRIILLTLFVFMTICTGVGQTRKNQTNDNLTPANLKRKYGSPNAKGQYYIGSDIGLTIKFKENGQPLEIRIEPLILFKWKQSKPESPEVMSSEAAEKVLNEIVPEAMRGKKGTTVDLVSSCLIDISTIYELVAIDIAKRCGTQEEGGGTYSINILWRK
ncbi:MAG: hypothetical protein ACR2HG_08720 [Pyrinomonadaceae bacterium]